MAIDASGRIVVGGWAAVSPQTDVTKFALARLNADGSLDTTFAGIGRFMIDLPIDKIYSQQSIEAVAIYPNGKIVIAGVARKATPSSASGTIVLARYNNNGSKDTSFGGNGTVITDFRGISYRLTAMALDAQGKIIVAGSSGASNGELGFALARFNLDGTPDNTFSGNGTITTDFGSNTSCIAEGIAIDSSGKIVAVGRVSDLGAESPTVT